MIAVDTNVLVYAHRRESPQHEAARAAVTELVGGHIPWGLPVFAIGEFLRVVTHPSLLHPPSTSDEALGAITALLESRAAKLLSPGERYWSILRTVFADARVRGNDVFDAQIVAVCLEHGADTILTEDRDFRRFTSIRVQHLP